MTERFLLKAGPQMLKATRAQSHCSAPALTKECFKRVRIVRQDFRRDLLRVSVCRRYPSQSDYETGHPRFPISPQARRGLHFDLDYWYLFKRLTAVSAGRSYRFEHIVTYSSGKVAAKSEQHTSSALRLSRWTIQFNPHLTPRGWAAGPRSRDGLASCTP